ncbi:MAG: hypothetical protein LH616_03810 [Ilumatobacteraceae bacterium]|nr:hypothetical protein [Ilumatobacteraceae bacterium]
MNGLRFVPDHAITGIPNVVVDGAPNPDTRLTLSHWPGAPTPPDLRDDLSAQIAFHAIARPDLFHEIEAVTNNHFDQDGLVSVFALLHPELAPPRRDQLIDIARAGDFGTFVSRDSARLAMVLAALDDDDRSPLAGGQLSQPYPKRCGALYEWTLPRLLEIVDHLDDWRHLWAEEDAHLTASLDAIAGGAVNIEEHPDIDLAVFTVPASWPTRATSRFTVRRMDSLHPMAVANSTDQLRIAIVHGGHCSVELRYESWVMLTSRPVLQRPDLRPLATTLDGIDPSGTGWHADGPGALTSHLRWADEGSSGLSPRRFLHTLRNFLRHAEPAWDPFAVR